MQIFSLIPLSRLPSTFTRSTLRLRIIQSMPFKFQAIKEGYYKEGFVCCFSKEI